MPNPTPLGPRLSKPLRRRLELAAAAAWESLVKTHVQHALNLVGLMEDHFSYEEALDRYVKETGLTDAMGGAVRNRALVHLEGVSPESLDDALRRDTAAREGRRAWPLRQITSVVQGLRRRVMGDEDVDEVLSLAYARAEEAVMVTHLQHAVAFAELLEEHVPAERAVKEYVDAVDLTGCRGQAVAQRAMARIADLMLPDLDGDGIPGHIPGGAQRAGV